MSSGSRLLFVFLDGVGLGSDDPAVNPLAGAGDPTFSGLLGGQLTASLQPFSRPELLFRHVDARLGVAGLPQSATGQSALLTGRNAAEVMGGHYGPWPGPTLKKVLDEGNLFSASVGNGLGATVANLYPPMYFTSLEQGRQRVNAPVHAALHAGLELRQLADFEAGQATSADLTGEYLAHLVPGSRRLTPAESAAELRQLASRHHFTFFDFWLSDQVGHRGTFGDAENLSGRLTAFLAAVLTPADDGVTVLVTSDHGNFEDKSVRTHTTAAVPLLASGPGSERFAGVRDLTGVAPAISGLLGVRLSPAR